jgi:predicted TIM-barrel fold metal-dependent hydrolase
MQIVDSHTHVDVSEAFGWYDPPEAILELMEQAGISRAVIMSYIDAPNVNDGIISYIADCVRKYPDKLIGYARIHPGYGERAVSIFIEAIRDLGFKGLKLHPESIVTHPYSNTAVSLVRKAGEMNVPTLFHSGDESLSLPLQIGKCAQMCPDSTIIMGHMGGFYHIEDAITTAEKYENIYLDTSAMPYPNMVKQAVDRIGAERVLFGSDGPGCNPALEVKKVKMAGLNEKQLVKVMGENILSILERVQKP